MEMISDEMRAEIEGLFEQFQTVLLATVDGDRPRVRPVTVAGLEEKRWILTDTEAAKIDQIRSNPRIELVFTIPEGDNTGYLRALGEAKIEEDAAIKAKIAEQTPYFAMFWKTHEDPAYALLDIVIDEIEYMKPGQMIPQRYRY